jgi:hypothetical protein
MPISAIDDITPAAEAFLERASGLLRFEPTMTVARLWLAALRADTPARIPGFDPLDAGPTLRHIYLLERDGDRMRYRVSGEAVNDLFGSSHGGKRLDEVVPSGIYPLIRPYYWDVFALKACVFKGYVAHSFKGRTEFERLLLPVYRNGQVQILGVLAMSSTAAVLPGPDVPPPVEPGFHFTQIDLTTGGVTAGHVPLDALPLDELPFEKHIKMRQPM